MLECGSAGFDPERKLCIAAAEDDCRIRNLFDIVVVMNARCDQVYLEQLGGSLKWGQNMIRRPPLCPG